VAKYRPITKTDFANLRWKRCSSYRFAARDAVVPLVVLELPRACMTLPIAFVQQGEAFVPAAVQGLQPGQNLFVAADGRWMGPYVPAAYRSYPFALAKADNGQFVLCVDADSDLVGEGHAEAFFDEQGEPSQSVKGILDFLQQIRANREATIRICAALNAENLIQPWPITLKHKDGEQTAQGLCRIDEARFNSLDADALRRVQQAGALAVAYCQLLSMQHLQTLGKLAEAHAGANGQLSSTSNGELDLEFLNSNDTLSFGPH
jgi:hypothetical protein